MEKKDLDIHATTRNKLRNKLKKKRNQRTHTKHDKHRLNKSKNYIQMKSCMQC